ncbi:hypothetical protein [Helicobacter bilis]|uniref:hypothetical protein n=1 Tax=Helicobacter bilis TaxID=37372 RepID=UPI002942E76B|nr:hypothetical protein [Helicobacter bilis]
MLVILDATNKDLETAYKLINKVIIPNMPNKDRILIVLNKCDCVIDRVDFVENGRKLTDEQIQYLDSKFLPKILTDIFSLSSRFIYSKLK